MVEVHVPSLSVEFFWMIDGKLLVVLLSIEQSAQLDVYLVVMGSVFLN